MAGLAGGFVGNFATVLLYAVISETLFYFLSSCFTALLAALCVVFAGNALAGDGRRVRLWSSVVGVGQAAAVLVALGTIAFAGSGNLSCHVGLGGRMNAVTVALAVVSVAASWGLRRPAGISPSGAKDGRSAALLVVLASLLLIAGVAVDGALNPVV